jgi:small GTP-binding protein
MTNIYLFSTLFKDFYRKEIELDGDRAILEILDTAGTEQFASMRDLYIKNGQGFIIVYSLSSRQSFQDVKVLREQIIRVKGNENVPIVLAANKCDVQGVEREVSSEEGCKLAAEWSVPYIETSAKNSLIVNSLFIEIVKEMNFKLTALKRNKKKGPKKPKKKKSICRSKSNKDQVNSSQLKLTTNSSSSSEPNSCSSTTSSTSKTQSQQSQEHQPQSATMKAKKCSTSLYLRMFPFCLFSCCFLPKAVKDPEQNRAKSYYYEKQSHHQHHPPHLFFDSQFNTNNKHPSANSNPSTSSAGSCSII